MGRVLKISTSTLKTVSKCSTQAVLYAEGKSGVGVLAEPLLVGSMFHEAIAGYFKSDGETETVVRDFRAAYHSAEQQGNFSPELLQDKPRFGLQNLEKLLGEWFNRHPLPDGLPISIYDKSLVEVPFEIEVGEIGVKGEIVPVRVIGYLDLLGEEGDDLWNWENKTTAWITKEWKSGFFSDPQITAYKVAAERLTGRRVLGTYINAVEISLLPNSPTLQCRAKTPHVGADGKKLHYSECGPLHANMVVFPVTQNEALEAQWQKDVLFFAKRYFDVLTKFVPMGIVGATRTRTQGKFTGACTFCDFNRWCINAGRDVDFAESMLTEHVGREDKDALRSGLYEET